MVVYLLNYMASSILDFLTPLHVFAQNEPFALRFDAYTADLWLCGIFLISIRTNVANLIHVCYVVFLWGMLHIRKTIGVFILLLSPYMLPWMSPSWSLRYIFLIQCPILRFMGRCIMKSGIWARWKIEKFVVGQHRSIDLSLSIDLLKDYIMRLLSAQNRLIALTPAIDRLELLKILLSGALFLLTWKMNLNKLKTPTLIPQY